MKCRHCGRSFVGTVSLDKAVSKLREEEMEGTDVRGENTLRSYYMCNGRNVPRASRVPDAPKCPSGYLRAKDLEELLWGEIQTMLRDPEGVIGELASLLCERRGEGVGESELFRELDDLRADAAGKEGERNALYRLFRKGMLPETDLESQLSELREEEVAIGARLEKVERAVDAAKDAKVSLDGARTMLLALREKMESSESWGSRRRVIENLVAGIEIETHFEGQTPRRGKRTVTLRVSYRFEVPELDDVSLKPFSGRLGNTVANVLGLTLVRTHVGLNFATDPFARARDAAREIVRENPSMKAKDVIAKVLAQTGESIRQASVSRIKTALKGGLKREKQRENE